MAAEPATRMQMRPISGPADFPAGRCLNQRSIGGGAAVPAAERRSQKRPHAAAPAGSDGGAAVGGLGLSCTPRVRRQQSGLL